MACYTAKEEASMLLLYAWINYITRNLQLQKLKDFFPVAPGPHLSEAYVDVANAQNLMYISCRHICVKSFYISCSFFFVMKKSLQM